MFNIQLDVRFQLGLAVTMPRMPRIETSDGLYHVLNRGNYRSFIFEEEGARHSFEKVLFEASERFGWRLHAHCVMSNHFHLCIGTPRGNLSEGMRWLQATYAARFNRYRKESGHLFQGRFKSLVVEPGAHFRDLIDYIHLNPVRAGMVDLAQLTKYRWTSLWHFPKRKSRPSFMSPEWMDYSDTISDSPGGWRRYVSELSLRHTDDPKEATKLDRQMCRGWCLGSGSFKKAIAVDLNEREGELRIEQDELGDFNRTRWAAALSSCLKKLGVNSDEIGRGKKSEQWKLAIASKLKRETSVTNAWLAESLQMGVPNAVSAICGRYARDAEKKCKFGAKLSKLNIEH